MKKILFFLGALFAFGAQAVAQDVSINYSYDFPEVVYVSQPPKFLSRPELVYSDTARKNGVEGTAKISLVLGADGQIKDVKLVSGLPFGVGEDALAAAQKMKFTPAIDPYGKATDLPMTISFTITLSYDESSKDVTKPKIIEKPVPAYPEKYRAEKLKDKVFVRILCAADGKVEVMGVNSTMPKEFDAAAVEAAKKIKFEPAVHKKTKKPVTQTLTVEFDFKP
jgi:TonB family protein